MAVKQKVIVTGGGPVGALAAVYAARRGFQVELYDLRDDPNFGDQNARPTIALIPLTLSDRGIRAIKGAGVPGLINQIMDKSNPLYMRMVHAKDREGNSKLYTVQYGPNGEALHTLPREQIAKSILAALQKEPTAKVFYNERLVACNLDKKTATFETVNWKAEYAGGGKPGDDRGAQDAFVKNPSRTREVSYDFLFGCDGDYSNVRQSMMRKMDMDFEVSYIHAKWCDLVIPAGHKGKHAMDPKKLHVWPDEDSIVVAFPAPNGSFRAGMIIDDNMHKDLVQHPEKIETQFRTRFPGIIPDLLSAEEVKRQFLQQRHISLKSVKCGSFGYKDTAVLLGDSAHSMTPFHGMGMITGLEDVRVFYEEFLDPALKAMEASNPAASDDAEETGRPVQHHHRLFCPPGVVQRYTQHRKPDAQAMTDMAAAHYNELRVNTRPLSRRAFDRVHFLLQKHLSSLGFVTVYSRIALSDERFSDIQKRENEQEKMLDAMVQWLRGIGISFILVLALKLTW